VNARTAILDRVRRAERTGHVPNVDRSRGPRTGVRLSPDEILGRFVQELTALGVQAFVEESGGGVCARLLALIGSRTVLRWDDDQLPYGAGRLFPSAATGRSTRDAQAAAEIGLTGADAGIAETGTLAVLSGDGKPRAASLLPPTHIAVIRRGDLLLSMGEFFQVHSDAMAGAACCTFITGPSRTADIELTLTLGVHGPGAVIVIVGP